MSAAPGKSNTFVGSPIERVEDLRFLRGRGQYVDDIVRDGLLHAAILRSSVAHGRIKSVDVDGGARSHRRPRRDHGGRRCRGAWRRADNPDAAGADAGVQAVRAAGHRPRQGALCRRADRGRCRRQSGGRRGCAGGDRARDRGAARRDGAAYRRGAAGREHGDELCGDPDRGARRRRCRVQGRALCAARALPGAAPHRGADGIARAAGRLGHIARPADGLRRRQGRLHRAAYPGGAVFAGGRRHHHDRGRRRRRLWRARRVLSRGLPHSVRIEGGRPAGEMDRGPARASHRDQSRTRCRVRP